MSYTVAAHNLYRKLPKWKVRRDLGKSSKAAITTYSEAQNFRDVLNSFCRRNNRSLYFPINDPGNPISWDNATFNLIAGKTWVIEAHKDTKHPGPARAFTAVGLSHRPSSRRVLVLSIHAENGYAKPEHATRWSDDRDNYKNWSATQYWLDVLSFVAGQMSLEYWDDIVISGDFNARMSNKKQWYFPGNMLDSITRKPSNDGIDYVLTTKDSKSSVIHMQKRKGWTDHPILVATLS